MGTMADHLSALQLIPSGDPALLAIVRLSLGVSLAAVALASAIGMPVGALLAKSSCWTSRPPISISPLRVRWKTSSRARRNPASTSMVSRDVGRVRRLAGEVVFLARGTLCERARASDFLDHPSTAEAQAFLRGDLLI
jgi:ABC-type histidine transport system ATPase subunit